jgi:hypothetical protein
VRPAGGHFHLLAQMKVTKAKCLNTIWLADVARTLRGPLVQPGVSLATVCSAAFSPKDLGANRDQRDNRIEGISCVGSCHVRKSNRIEAFFFGSFLLGQQKKGTRQAGRDRRALTQ